GGEPGRRGGGRATTEKGGPREPQNRAPSWSAAPHWGHVTRRIHHPSPPRRRPRLLISQPMRALAALLVVTTVPVSLAAQPVEPVQPVQDDPTFGPLIPIDPIHLAASSP